MDSDKIENQFWHGHYMNFKELFFDVVKMIQEPDNMQQFVCRRCKTDKKDMHKKLLSYLGYSYNEKLERILQYFAKRE